MSFSSIIQVVTLTNETGVSKATKKPFDFLLAKCLLLDETGSLQQTGRMVVPEALRASLALDTYSVGFALTVASFGKRKGEVVPRILSLTSMSTGVIAATATPACQILQILKIDDLKTGVSESGRPWSRLSCEVMLLTEKDGKYVPADVGRIAIPEAMRDGLKVGTYSGTFSLGVQTFGDEKEKHEVSARLTGLTPVQGGFVVGLPRPPAAPSAAGHKRAPVEA